MSLGWNLDIGPNSLDSLSALSTEWDSVLLAVTKNGAAYNPVSDVVQFAFVQGAATQPQTSNWVTGAWDTTGDPVYPYAAKCLVGPAGTAILTQGTYYRWIKITDSPEVPVMPAGQLVIF